MAAKQWINHWRQHMAQSLNFQHS